MDESMGASETERKREKRFRERERERGRERIERPSFSIFEPLLKLKLPNVTRAVLSDGMLRSERGFRLGLAKAARVFPPPWPSGASSSARLPSLGC